MNKIKNKLKQLKYQHLKKIYSKKLSRHPSNCKYNKEIRLPNRTKLNICIFNLEDTPDVDLCYKTEHAKECNAFCTNKSKQDLYNDFIKDLGDPSVRATKFKDINILYWLYPELNSEFTSKKPLFKRILSFFKNIFSSFI